MHAIFSGRVQGVGFRYSAREAADDIGACGWVRNLRNGSVEMIAEAPRQALEQLLEVLKDRFGSYIRDADVVWEPASGEFKDFRITF
jgi:acylphosphatase